MPKPLDFDRLKQFEARSPEVVEPEAVVDGQISIKAPLDVLDRFKRICKDDRRTYADMLGILMDRYEVK